MLFLIFLLLLDLFTVAVAVVNIFWSLPTALVIAAIIAAFILGIFHAVEERVFLSVLEMCFAIFMLASILT